jgi:hypothetical protein
MCVRISIELTAAGTAPEFNRIPYYGRCINMYLATFNPANKILLFAFSKKSSNYLVNLALYKL